jgi:hypothetical protein
MYCKKCKYVSFDHLDKCPKCGMEWAEERKKLGIDWLKAQEKGWLETDNDNSDRAEPQPGISGSEPDEFAFDPESPAKDVESLLHAEDQEPGFEDEPVQTSAGEGDFDAAPGFELTDKGPSSKDDMHVPPGDDDLEVDIDLGLDEEIENVSRQVDQKIEPETDSGLEPEIEFTLEHEDESSFDPLPESEPDEVIKPGPVEEMDAGLEPDLDFEFRPEAEIKSKPEEPSEQEQEYEIEYPDLEFIDPGEKKS